jgi:hypothetical protein
MSDNTHQPSPGFEFPTSARDKIDETLRNLGRKEEPIRSVRPDRQHSTGTKPVVPTIVPVEQPQVAAPVKRTLPAAAPAANTIQTPHVQATPMVSADMVSIDLPSRFAYYPFKDLYVKPFRAVHLAKLAKADHDMSMQLIVETVSSVLATPGGDQNIAFRLSMPDLNAVMYWLRMHSFTKQTMRVTSQCGNAAHVQKVNDGELDHETLKIETQVTESDVEIRFLDVIPDPDYFKLVVADDEGKEVVIPLRPETALDSIAFLDHPDFLDPEFQYKIKIISLMAFEVAMPEVEWTVARKVEFFDEFVTTDHILMVNEFAALIDNYGVVESVKTHCGKCGASGSAPLAFDATTFLAPAF